GIVARLARAMEGTVCIETEPGEGTTVWVTLTAHEAPAEVVAPSPAEPEAPAAADPAVVLLAEDNRVNRILGERLLRRLGHQALTAATGVEVLEILRRVPVDCVLLDIQMPEMDGLEAARRIRAGEAGRPDVPLVAMTAHAMSGDREQFLAAGMDSYLAKPFDLADLARVLAEVLARRAGAAAPGAASGPGPA
ncbi:MAG: response regulator, partial [Desulfovibrionaceae bacterium]